MELVEKRSDEIAYQRRRADVYNFLSRLYYEELDEAFIAQFAETMQIIALDAFDDEVERQLAKGNNLMLKYLLRRTRDTRTELKCEYAKVFLAAGVYEGRSASPYESVYTSEEHLLMSDARDDVYRLFCENGVAIDDHYHMPEDHISFEFQYLALLCQHAAEALEASDDTQAEMWLERQADFFTRHVMNWVPDFCGDLEDLARTDFYRGLGLYTDAWIRMEAGGLCNDAWIRMEAGGLCNDVQEA
jgi:putative dimethyl sulfoxide reductase chaperone